MTGTDLPDRGTETARHPLRAVFRLGVALVFLALVGWTIYQLGPRRVLAVAREADPWWLLLSLVALSGRFLLWGIKWDRILRRRAPIAYRVALRTLMAGSFINLTTPTAKLAGGILRALLLNRRYGWGAAASYGRALCDQATTAVGVIALFGALALTVSLLSETIPGRRALGSVGILVLALVAVTVALRPLAWAWIRKPEIESFASRRIPARLFSLDPDRSVKEWIYEVFYPLLGEGRAIATYASDVTLAALSFGSLCLANALVLRALGVEAELWLIATAVVMGYFAGSIIGAWGGIGVTEATLAALYVRIGVPPDTATAAALLHRAMFYTFVLLGGGIALAVENRSSRRAAERR